MKNILTAVDFSDVTDRVVAKAGQFARAMNAKVWLLHVVSDTSFISGAGEVPVPWTVSDDELPKHFPSEAGKLSEIVNTLKAMGVQADHLLVSGPAVERVLTLAEEKQADMIVMGSHGHGALYKLLVGTISEGVLRKANVPVLIVPSTTQTSQVESSDQTQWVKPMATPY